MGWLWKEICRRFGLPAEKPFIIKAADMASQWPEFKQLLPPNRIPTLDRNTQMLEEHFPHVIDEARKLKIRALSPAKAKRKFLHSIYQLHARRILKRRTCTGGHNRQERELDSPHPLLTYAGLALEPITQIITSPALGVRSNVLANSRFSSPLLANESLAIAYNRAPLLAQKECFQARGTLTVEAGSSLVSTRHLTKSADSIRA